MEHFNSEWWFTPLEEMADAFYYNSDRDLVIYYKDMFGAIKQKYSARLRVIKTDMYGDNFANNDDKVDRHKITALYIQLFLENPIFLVKEPKPGLYPSTETIFINEHYCLDILYSILRSWTRKAFKIKLFEDYKMSFMRLLANYRKSHSEIDKVQPNFRFAYVDKYPEYFHFTYALAHIIYFIERNFWD